MSVPLGWPAAIWRGDASASAGVTAAGAVRVNPVVRSGLYLYVMSIPFEWPGRPFPIEIPTLAGAIFLLTTLAQPSVCFRRFPPALVCFIVFLWVFALSVVVNGVPHGTLALEYFLNFSQVILLFWAIFNILADERVLRGVLLWFVAACIVRAGMQVLGIGVTMHPEWTGGERLTVLGQNSNLSAMILAGAMAVVIGLQVSAARRFPRFGPFTLPAAALLGLSVLQTGSRGGVLCVAAGLATFCFSGRTLLARVRNGLLAVIALVLLGWGAFQSEVLRGRFLRAAEEQQFAGRERIYPAALQMVRERPVLGWGPIENQFEIGRRIRERLRPQRDAHNLVLELLTATGLVGAVPFLAAMFLCVRNAWRARGGPLGILPLAVIVAVLVGTVPSTWIASKIVWFALALGLAAGAHWSRSHVARPWSRAELEALMASYTGRSPGALAR